MKKEVKPSRNHTAYRLALIHFRSAELAVQAYNLNSELPTQTYTNQTHN